MIERVYLRDFQCHEDLEITFDRITSIVGDSDRGKTAVLRAISWVVFNRPSGDLFVRFGSGRARVDLEVGGKTVGRVRGGRNLYRFLGQDYQAFGREVPADILRHLNLGAINFIDQHSGPFWFLRSPGEVSRELNAVVNLGLIDSTLANLAGEVRRARTSVEVSRSRLSSAEAHRDSLSWVPEADRGLCRLEAIESSVKEKTERIGRLRRSWQEAASLQGRGDRLAEAAEAGGRVLKIGERVMALEDRIAKITGLVEKVMAAEEHLCSLRKELEEAERVLWEGMGGRCPLCGQTTTSRQFLSATCTSHTAAR